MIFLLVVIFFVSFGTILFELTLTRIFSIILWYDYAFIAISVAFFGLGVGAITVYISRSKAKIVVKDEEFINFNTSKIVQSAVTFAISLPVFVSIIVYVIPPNINFIYLFYLASSIPFYFAGMTLAFIYIAMPKEISKLYFVDLAGAAIATLVLDPFMQKLGAESTLLSLAVMISAISVAAYLALQKSAKGSKKPQNEQVKLGIKTKLYVIAVLAITTIITLANISSANSILSIQPGENKGLHKTLSNPSLRLLSTVWNSFSRIDVSQSSSFDPKKDRELAGIQIDADAWTAVWRWNGSVSDLDWIKWQLDFLPYDIAAHGTIKNTLIVGSGGGGDVLMALAGGSKKVTAVEINPSIVSEVKKFGKLAGNLYEHKDVDLYIDDGRRFISSTQSKYNIIVIRLVDSWAAQLAGGYALSENYLYTVEAFHQYLQHLDQDNGLLFMVRWNIELPRLMPLLIESLRQEQPGKSIDDIARQIVVIEDCNQRCSEGVSRVQVLAKNSPFTNSELNIIKNKVAKYNATFVAMAGQIVQPPYDSLLSTEISDLKLLTDDSPFYFAKEPIPKQMITLLGTILILSTVLTAILIYYSRINKIQKNGHIRFHILFVILIGLGFIFLEITFIQKFLLLLGTPILALTVILFSILLSAGIGSYLSGRLFAKEPLKAIAVSIPILVGIVVVYYIFLQEIIYSNIGLQLPQRILLSLALLSPVGIVMGFQFPSIIRMAYSPPQTGRKEDSDREKNTVVTLLWGVNVIASVVGTVLTVISSMTVGFSGNLLIAAGLYLGALCSVVLIRQRQKLHIIRESM
jgi:Spermine/spermidine synthase domain